MLICLNDFIGTTLTYIWITEAKITTNQSKSSTVKGMEQFLKSEYMRKDTSKEKKMPDAYIKRKYIFLRGREVCQPY